MRASRSNTLLRAMAPCAFIVVAVGASYAIDAIAQGDEFKVAGVPRDAAVEHGPTLKLSYSRETFETNPISSFMYFVPLLSRTAVARETSDGNGQEVIIISNDRQVRGKSFVVTCDFEIRGSGFHKNVFDPAGAISLGISELEKNEPLTEALDYIKIEGEGLGRIVVKGRNEGATQTITKVDLDFKAGAERSPVTIGIYDIKPAGGRYAYEQRSNERVARVNTLSFSADGTQPRMAISVASVREAGGKEGFIARVKGVVASLVIKPPRIERLGNETVLRLGHAVLNRSPEFTFPVAKNLK